MKLYMTILGSLSTLVLPYEASPNSPNGKIICYFNSSSINREGPAAISADMIKPDLCDIFIYGFVGLDIENQTLTYLDPDRDAILIPQLRDKARASGTKFLAAIGDWRGRTFEYSLVIRDAIQRCRLVRSIAKFVEDNRLDGFEIDWDYSLVFFSDYRNAFSAYFSELKDIFAPKGWLLSASVYGNTMQMSKLYHIPFTTDNLDIINLIAFEFHARWVDRVGHHAPLYVRDSDYPHERHLNVDSIIKGWLNQGADSKKLYLGIASFARVYNLQNPLQNQIGAPTSQQDDSYFNFIGYNEICANNGSYWTTAWDNQQQVPYAYNGRKWVGFDDVTSVRLKTCLAKQNNLGGVVLRTIDTDDFRGVCGKGKFPLLRSIAQALSDPTCGSDGNPEVSNTSLPPSTPRNSKSKSVSSLTENKRPQQLIYISVLWIWYSVSHFF